MRKSEENLRKKITILFYGENLSYSPTVIGLYDLLSKHFDVTIIARRPTKFGGKTLPNRKVIYIEGVTSEILRATNDKIFRLLGLFNKKAAKIQESLINLDTLREYVFLKKYFAKESPDSVIAVDFKNLWFARLLGKKVEFLSLEIVPNDIFYRLSDFSKINSVVIQTKERYEHLFAGKEYKTFFVQNAPVFDSSSEPAPSGNRKNLVYCGTAWDAFGFFHCLDFLERFPEYSMNVKGVLPAGVEKQIKNRYAELLAGERLIIDDDYLDDAQVVGYLRRFRIGFCFYNFDVEWIDNFNYQSAPSGKMFKYFAAGVPVVGLSISGLKPVKEFDCGVLIEDLKPESIKKAIDAVESDYEYYSRNCRKAAEHYSFDKMAAPFVDYLLKRQ